MTEVKDISGRRFGTWTVLRLLPERAPDRQAVWLCKCDCGAERGVKAGALRSGASQSCTSSGCSKGTLSKHHLYRRWLNVVGRCTNPEHKDWENYGGRGITVCDRWLVLENFVSDMEPTFKPGLQIDRKENDQGYTFENCHWTTAKINSRNKRDTIYMETPWGRMPQAEAAERLDWPTSIMHDRRRRGWSYARIFAGVAVIPPCPVAA